MSGGVPYALRQGGWSALGWLGSALLLLQAQLQVDSDWGWPLLAVAWVPWGLVLPRSALACWLEGAALLVVAGLPLIMGAASAIGLPPSLTALVLLSLGLALPFGLAGRVMLSPQLPERWLPWRRQGVLLLGLLGYWLLDLLKSHTVANWMGYVDPLGESSRMAPVLGLLGAGGAGLLLVLINAGLQASLQQRRWRWLGLPLALVALPACLGGWSTAGASPLEVGVQTLRLALVVPYREEQLEQMSEQEVAQGLLAAYRQLDPAQVDLAILPQSGLAGLAVEDGVEFSQLLQTVAERGIPLLAGAHPPASMAPGALLTTYNSGFLLTPGLARQLLKLPYPAMAQLPWQHKRFLVPVGEYDPRWLSWWPGHTGLSRLHVMRSGSVSQPLLLPAPPTVLPATSLRRGVRLGVMLCYDTYFPEVSHQLRAAGAEVLIVLSSDMAFHGSALSRQGLRTTRLRGMEQGLPVVRIAWSPAGSGVYTAQGEAVAALPVEQTGMADGVALYALPLTKR